MVTSTYDPCLLITNDAATGFSLVAMQTDDTLMLITPAFSTEEEKRVREVKFRTKPKTTLAASETKTMDFNGCILQIEQHDLFMR